MVDSENRRPWWLRAITPILRAKRFPVLPPDPEQGNWYRVYPDGRVGGNGSPAYADFRRGTENKLLVFFSGGGVSVDAFTAARPVRISTDMSGEMFYVDDVDLFSDRVSGGILSDRADNPFRAWHKLMLTYTTGDFHVGTADFPYTSVNGVERTLHHHGFTNYRAAIEEVRRWIPAPDSLVISGCSGGAFGAALLADDLMEQFPECPDVTCCVDSGLALSERWVSIAEDVWGAPPEIAARVRTNDITSDALRVLNEVHGDRVRILYLSSVRDGALARLQTYLSGGRLVFSKMAGERYQHDLATACERLRREVPGIGIYVFDAPGGPKKMNLTRHCAIGDKTYRVALIDGKSPADWVWDAVNGDVRSYGLQLLGL